MDSSSDDSFAWTNASNSSDSSIENIKMTKDNRTENGLDDNSDNEGYKKKLHKKLLVNNDANDESHQDAEHDTKRKRKRVDNDIVESPKRKKIKLEPESDVDTPKKKKKKKKLDHSGSNEPHEESNIDVSQNHSNLNITVKQEPELVSPSPKSKKQRNSDLNIIKHENNGMETISETQDINNSVDYDVSYLSKKKKKKSKKKRTSQSDDNNVGTGGKVSEDTSLYLQQEETEQLAESKMFISKHETSTHKDMINKRENSSVNKSELSSDDEQSHKSNLKFKSNNNSLNAHDIPENNTQRVSSISDKTKFENENNSQLDNSINNEVDKTNSRKLKKFLKINENLRPVSIRSQGDWVLSSDDEVWAVRCPHNIDINAFLGVKIKLNKKCKIKVEGQTYEGTMNDDTNSLTVLSLENNNYVIKKLPLNGMLHLRKRIPKVHIQENDIVLKSQMDFVPLPVTKSRHPLFGSNYKKAIKIPNAIAQRLKDPYNETLGESESKKIKKKKNKNMSMNVDTYQPEEAQDFAPENDESTVKIKKKSRKRKLEVDGELGSSKRARHNADSTTVWESEQAIEENLFNF